MKKCCETCRHDLGGGYDNCRINLEAECAAGGYEAWEPKENKMEQMKNMDLTVFAFPNGETVAVPAATGPIGDGFYTNPLNRYMGLANRPAMRSCGTCTYAGLAEMCRHCMNRFPTFPEKR